MSINTTSPSSKDKSYTQTKIKIKKITSEIKSMKKRVLRRVMSLNIVSFWLIRGCRELVSLIIIVMRARDQGLKA